MIGGSKYSYHIIFHYLVLNSSLICPTIAIIKFPVFKPNITVKAKNIITLRITLGSLRLSYLVGNNDMIYEESTSRAPVYCLDMSNSNKVACL
jgi:hypothetical protein